MKNLELKIFLISIIIMIFLSFFFGEVINSSFLNQLIFFSIPLIWPGLAHGSLDIYSAERKKIVKNKYDLLFFLLTYVAIPVIFFLFWMNFSNIAFLIFLILSASHFGISDKFPIKLNNYEKIAEIVLRGALVISLPIQFHFNETKIIFSSLMVDNSFIDFLKDLNFIFLFFLSFCGLILTSSCLIKKRYILICEIYLIFFCFLYFKPLISFLLYFCFFHSIRHLMIEKYELNIGFRELFIKTLPMTLLCLFPLVISLIFPKLFFSAVSYEYLNYIVIGLSCLTLSHIILINFIENDHSTG